MILETWPIPTGNIFSDRRKRVENIINDFNLELNSKILDIGGAEYKEYCKNNNFIYTSINIEEPLKFGDPCYETLPDTLKYDGRNLPFKTNDFDVILINFVLHHAAENTIHILKQVKDISSKYVIIGEDLAEINYSIKWHVRNFKHQPGGIFRSDIEWKELFDLIGFNLIKQIVILRADDEDEKIYRTIYVLETRKSG